VSFAIIHNTTDLFKKSFGLVQCGGQFEGVCLPECPDGMKPWGLDSGEKSTCSKQKNLNNEQDNDRKAFLVEQGLSESTIDAKDWAKDRRYWTTCCVKNNFIS
jgi:hypothetical protein